MKKTVYDTLHIYGTKGIRAKLEALAGANRRSLSAEMQVLIEEAYEQRFTAPSPTKKDLV
jgi:hypothetical protein